MLRITNSMMISRAMRNQSNNLRNMDKWNNDLNAMTHLHKPSDDPVKVGRTLRLQSEITLSTQYSDNLDSAKAWLETTESSLSEVNKVMQRIREITVQGANGVLKEDDKSKISQEIGQLREHLITVSNQTYTGRHIFSGYRSDLAFTNSDGTYNENANTLGVSYQSMEYKVGVSQNLQVNYTGDRIFGSSYSEATITGKRLEFANDPATNPELTTQFDFGITLDIQKRKIDPATGKPVLDGSGNPVIEDGPLSITVNSDPTKKYKNGDIESVVNDLNAQIKAPPNPAGYEDKVKFVVDKDRIAIVSRDYDIETTVVEVNAAGVPTDKLGKSGLETKPNVEATQPLKPMFEMLTKLQGLLEAGDSEQISNMLSDVDAHLQNILQISGEIGAKINMVDIMQTRMDETLISTKDLLSKTRDTNMGEAIMNLSIAEAVYKSSLAVSARIIQPTLVDFLR
jgi:flagellar hook-associated protein 3 FlgL